MSRRPGLAAMLLACTAASGAVGFTAPAQAGEVRITCYSDGNECPATKTLAERFMKDNSDVKITIDEVPYKSILESLPVQLASGNGPDIARVTIFGPVLKYLADMRPNMKDPATFEANFGPALTWMRSGPTDKGIYGLPTQTTVSAPIVNKTLFEQANVPMPAKGATWDEWGAALEKVAKATKTPYGFAIDRSGHRFAGALISSGAKFFDASGNPAVVDDGFKTMATKYVNWAKSGVADKDVWVSSGGGYRDAFEEFKNGKLVMYFSGSWQVKRLETAIGEGFDWVIAPEPCGPASCTGMPGGAAFVAFKDGKNPKDTARFLEWLGSDAVYAEYMAMTSNLPASAGVQKMGVQYKLTPAGNAAMKAFTADITTLSPVAYQVQGYPYSSSLLNPIADRLSQAMAGQLTLDQAFDRITSDVKDAMAAIKK